MCQVQVRFDDAIEVIAVLDKVEDLRYRDARAGDDWLSDQDIGVDGDAAFIVALSAGYIVIAPPRLNSNPSICHRACMRERAADAWLMAGASPEVGTNLPTEFPRIGRIFPGEPTEG